MADPGLELRALRAEVGELREDVQHLTRALLASEDRRMGAVIVPLAGDIMGPRTFTPSELRSAAAARRDATGAALLEAIRDMADADGGLRALGRLFVRVRGRVFAGLRLVEAGAGRWSVVAVSGPENADR